MILPGHRYGNLYAHVGAMAEDVLITLLGDELCAEYGLDWAPDNTVYVFNSPVPGHKNMFFSGWKFQA